MSVLDQDYDNLEVVIIDDASDLSEPRDIAHDLARDDQRVQVVMNSDRLAPYKSVAGVGPRLTGDYFAILNDDDRWEPNFLKLLTAPLDDDAALVASFCDHNVINRDGEVDQAATNRLSRRSGRGNLAPGRHLDSAKLSLGSWTFPTVVGSLFRNSAKLWSEFAGAQHDVKGSYDLWLQACALGKESPVWYVPKRLSSYRIHGDQLWSKDEPRIELARATGWIFEEVLASDRFSTVADDVSRRLGNLRHDIGMAYLRRGQRVPAAYYLRTAVSLRLRPKTIAGLALSFGGDGRLAASVRGRILERRIPK